MPDIPRKAAGRPVFVGGPVRLFRIGRKHALGEDKAAEKAVKSKKGDAASAVKERGKPTAADSAVRRGPRP